MLSTFGCGDNVREPASVQSGSRLKLARYVYPGGAHELELDWYFDAELQQRCRPQLWSDGFRYCGPAADEAVFIDDACTRALGRTLRGLQPARYFTTTFQLTVDSPAQPSRIFHRGAPADAPVTIWRNGLGGCLPAEPGDNLDYFELGEELPRTQLVRLRRGEPQGAGELALVHDLTDDGFRLPAMFVRRDSRRECSPTEIPNVTMLECAPTVATSITHFRDSQCAERVAVTLPGEMPALATSFDPATSCTSYYRVGAPISASALYERASGSACVEVAPPSGRVLYAMAGVEVPALLARERASSAERIRSIARITDALRVPDTLVYDSELDTDCKHDAELRCVPRTSATRVPPTHFYSDADCRRGINIALVPSGDCDPPTSFATDGDRYYPLLAPYTAAIFAPSTGATCVGYTPPAPLVPYMIGAAIDPDAFARAELVIDP
jgi:hypothetical protein